MILFKPTFIFFTSISLPQSAGIKFALDTGYPPEIQEGLINKLNLRKVVDGYVSSYQVKEGRPYPYMVYRLMEATNT